MTRGEQGESTRAREHLANERTLLAWVRTAIALMGLGFVIARFGLFLRQLALERAAPPEPVHASAVIGAALVAASVLLMALSTVRFSGRAPRSSVVATSRRPSPTSWWSR